MIMIQFRVPSQTALTSLAELTRDIQAQETIIRQGGSEAGRERQKQLGRLTARERLGELLDEGAPAVRIGPVGGLADVPDWGDVPAAGVVTAHRTRSRTAGHGRRQRCDRQGRRLLSANREEGPPRPAHRHDVPAAAGLSGRFRRRVPAACRTKSFPTRTTSGGSSATTRSSPRWAFPSMPP